MVETSPVPSRKLPLTMSFDKAIEAIMEGKKVRREEWPDAEEHGVLADGFLKIFVKGRYHGWTVSEGDMLATDWVITK